MKQKATLYAELYGGFAPIIILLITITGVIGFLYFRNQYTKISNNNSPIISPKPSNIPTESTLYINKKYNFTISFPDKIEIPDLYADYGYLGDKIYFGVSEHNPLDCRGDCPLIEKVTKDVSIAGLKATKIEGYFGEIGGNIAQHYVEYVFTKDAKDFTFTQQALSKNTDSSLYYKNLTAENSNPQVSSVDRKNFDQIISTFKFTDTTKNSTQSCGGIANLKCSDGFVCKITDTYPDASGTCVSDTAL